MKTRSGFKQSINPYLEVRDGVVHGKEFDSMMALTAFAGMAPIWDWYEKQIGDSSVATQEPGFVVFYGDIVPSVWLPVPLVQMDNAVYLAGVDVWMIFPVGNQEGVPYAMNRGVWRMNSTTASFFKTFGRPPPSSVEILAQRDRRHVVRRTAQPEPSACPRRGARRHPRHRLHREHPLHGALLQQ